MIIRGARCSTWIRATPCTRREMAPRAKAKTAAAAKEGPAKRRRKAQADVDIEDCGFEPQELTEVRVCRA